MYSGDLMTIMAPLPEVNGVDSFFQEIRDISEAFVRRSLMQYVAYDFKVTDAQAYLLDPTVKVPYLEKEASLRGVSLPDTVKSVMERRDVLVSIIREYELIRVEFNLLYEGTSSPQERLTLRDKMLSKAKALVESIPV